MLIFLIKIFFVNFFIYIDLNIQLNDVRKKEKIIEII